jgi:hypothetical protein
MHSPATGGVQTAGYVGPVVHWWRDSLLYCGPGFDWRYEGIIQGYLALYRRSGDQRWLNKAVRAGDDLLAAQLPSGNFHNSAFELNPTTAGTPHEAAADIGLLALASQLRESRDPAGGRYLAAAHRNLDCFYLAHLWDVEAGLFWDDPARTGFVPNKAATLVEALFILGDLTGDERWQVAYARPTLDAILRYQVQQLGQPLDGGIAQSGSGRMQVEKYFPYYVARCIPALVEGGRRFGEDRYVQAGLAAGAFLQRWQDPDGAFPQVVYPGGGVNRYPRWIAGLGDVLRALELLQPHGLTMDLERTRQWLLRGQLLSGAFKSAEGFGSQVSQRAPTGCPDMRDILPVVGWNDKAFRYLAGQSLPAADDLPSHSAVGERCMYHGAPAELRQDEHALELRQASEVVLRWQKGAQWAEIRRC